ncbi:MAG: hypothetical protein KC420_05810, partial [Myxococcales bacterium]|nr:hypothetical protein [Myxococcales bacterium]
TPSPASAPAAGDAAAAPGRPPGPPEGSSGVDEVKRLEGVGEAALLAELGEPTRRREFTMAECCTEFQIELLNTYPPKSGHEAVVIREWTWTYEGYALTAWLHEVEGEWRVLDTCRYSDDVEF